MDGMDRINWWRFKEKGLKVLFGECGDDFISGGTGDAINVSAIIKYDTDDTDLKI